MKNTSLRALTCTLCATLALAGGLVLGGCSGGPNVEELVREDITTNFDELKNMDEEALEEYAGAVEGAGLEAYGIDNTELVAAMVDGFDYTIDSVEVDDESAVATVTVTSKSMGELTNMDSDAMVEELMNAINSGELDVNDDDAVNAWAGEYVMGLVAEIEPSEKTIELVYNKTDDGWEIDNSANTEISKIFV